VARKADNQAWADRGENVYNPQKKKAAAKSSETVHTEDEESATG
jgi:hypothetical protein